MRAHIVRLHSPDHLDLAGWRPEDPKHAGAFVQIIAGPEGTDGEESFDTMVGTRSYLDELPPDEREHEIEVPVWDFAVVTDVIDSRVRAVEGESWRAVAEQLNVFARWEFDQYEPFDT